MKEMDIRINILPQFHSTQFVYFFQFQSINIENK
jgi:hypothetical protein